MTFLVFLRWSLIGVGVLDLYLVAAAITRARHQETWGRLLSTFAVLAGLVLGSTGRLLQSGAATPPASELGLILTNLGLLGYALFLPERGLLAAVTKRWRK